MFVFRVDGGSIYSLATGHISRCLKMADYLSEHNNLPILFIMKRYEEGICLVNDKYSVIKLDPRLTLDEEVNVLKGHIKSASVFFCDIRKITNDYINKIRKTGAAFVLFDDLKIKHLYPDMIINPQPFVYRDYNKNIFPNTDLLVGEKYFFIGDKIIATRRKRSFNQPSYRILVSFGGADPCNITEYFIENIAPKLERHRFTIVLGPAYELQSHVISMYGKWDNMTFVTNTYPMDSLFSQHDIAFVCGGDTCIEACANGLATFIISSIYYEKQFAEILHTRKIGYFVADIEDIKKENINWGFLEIFEQKERLVTLSGNGLSLIDGDGKKRVCEMISKFL